MSTAAKSTLLIPLLIWLGGCEIVADFDRDKIPTTTTRPPGSLPVDPYEPVPNVPMEGGAGDLDASPGDASALDAAVDASSDAASPDAALNGGTDAALDGGDAELDGATLDAAVDDAGLADDSGADAGAVADAG